MNPEEGSDFTKKKNKEEDNQIASVFHDKVQVSETGEHHHSTSTSSDEGEGDDEETSVPVENVNEEVKPEDKMPGQQKKPDDNHHMVPTPVEAAEAKEKKGLLDKIKEKFPGFHSQDKNEAH